MITNSVDVDMPHPVKDHDSDALKLKFNELEVSKASSMMIYN